MCKDQKKRVHKPFALEASNKETPVSRRKFSSESDVIAFADYLWARVPDLTMSATYNGGPWLGNTQIKKWHYHWIKGESYAGLPAFPMA
jgi:hypothetical protein